MTDKTDSKERDLQRIAECAARLVEHADFQLGGVLSADSKARDIPSRACSQVKARHLAALRDALAGRASLAASAGSEPVAEVVRNTAEDAQFSPRSAWPLNNFHDLPLGTKLYTHPSPPEGMVMVPLDLAIDSPIRDVLITWMEKGIKGECFLYKDMWAAVIAAATPPTSSADSSKGE